MIIKDKIPTLTESDKGNFSFKKYSAKEMKYRRTAALDKVNHRAAVFLSCSLAFYFGFILSRYFGYAAERTLSLIMMAITLFLAWRTLRKRPDVIKKVDASDTYIEAEVLKIDDIMGSFEDSFFISFFGKDRETGYETTIFVLKDIYVLEAAGVKERCVVKVPVFLDGREKTDAI